MSKQSSRQPMRQTQRRERREEMRRQDQAHLAVKRRRKVIITVVIAGAVLVGAVIGFMALTGGLSSSTNGGNQLAPSVGNVQCNESEQLKFHIHAHLSVHINGQDVQLPERIGITNTCFYWLHTHDTSGIIHIEGPKPDKYTLGTFFQLWRQRFSQLQYQNQLSSTEGWEVYIDGKPYKGDFNDIELTAHKLITLAYNSPGIIPDKTYNWGNL